MIAAGVSECSPKLEQYYVNINGEVCDDIDAELFLVFGSHLVGGGVCTRENSEGSID